MNITLCQDVTVIFVETDITVHSDMQTTSTNNAHQLTHRTHASITSKPINNRVSPKVNK